MVSVLATEARAFEGRARPSSSLIRLLALASIALGGLAMQLSAYINHDVAWVLWGAREMLGGAAWGRDIIEPNPPLAWYLAMPSTWVAQVLGIPTAAAFEVAVAGAAVASVLVFDKLFPRERERPALLVPFVAALFLLVFPDRDFGQREHLMLIAVLPYVALVAARCAGRSVTPTAAIAIGVAAGLGLALKPYFLAVPLLVELTAMLLVRRWTFVFRAETFAIGASVLAYAASLLIFHGEYLTAVLPLATDIFWAFDMPWPKVLAPLMVPVAAGLFGVATGAPRRLVPPLLLAAALGGFALSCLVQHKGYSYHVFPVAAGGALVAAAALASAGLSLGRRSLGWALLSVLLLQGAVETSQWWDRNRPQGSRSAEIRRLVGAIDGRAGEGGFLAVAIHPYPGFPIALYTRSRQVSRFACHGGLSAVVLLRGDRHADPAALRRVEAHARTLMLRDLAQAPRLVLIDTDSRRHTAAPADFDFLAFFEEDARFRQAWKRYREVGRLGKYRLFERIGGPIGSGLSSAPSTD